jgi:hypothetical protein
MIHYLRHHEIDKRKWDNCITSSLNKMVYGCSWYLDVVSPGWEGLIMDDYKVVMALPAGKKYGIPYLIQPLLTTQGGIFYNHPVRHELCNEFLDNIPASYKYVNIHMNKDNGLIGGKFKIELKANHYLDLNPSYQALRKNYSRRTLRNINNALNCKLIVKEGKDADEFVDFKCKFVTPKILDKQRKTMKRLVDHCLFAGNGHIVNAFTQNGELSGAAFYLVDQDQLYLMVTVSSPTGKECNSMPFIVDDIIQKHCGQSMIMDFTGSSLKGVAYFNEGFGALKMFYSQVTMNHLPWPLNYLKR